MANEQINTQAHFRIAEPSELGVHREISTLLLETTVITRDLPESPHGSGKSLIVASGKKGNIVRFVFRLIGSIEIPGGVGPCFD